MIISHKILSVLAHASAFISKPFLTSLSRLLAITCSIRFHCKTSLLLSLPLHLPPLHRFRIFSEHNNLIWLECLCTFSSDSSRIQHSEQSLLVYSHGLLAFNYRFAFESNLFTTGEGDAQMWLQLLRVLAQTTTFSQWRVWPNDF